jgi:tetratricopeptide (TPR) repeat protein
MRLLAAAAAVLIVALSAAAPPARAAQPDPERKALEAFAAGRYDEALNIYAKLYADTLHPVYLRNIGRCHQKLRDPDRAIESFREYLRRGTDITPAERAEIEGFMAEMESLRAERARAAATPPPPPQPQPQPQPQPAPSLDARAEAPPPMDLAAVPAAAPPATEVPFYKRGWFWAVAGGVVVAGLAGGAALMLSGKTQAPILGNVDPRIVALR